jgi:hypothetical protein
LLKLVVRERRIMVIDNNSFDEVEALRMESIDNSDSSDSDDEFMAEVIDSDTASSAAIDTGKSCGAPLPSGFPELELSKDASSEGSTELCSVTSSTDCYEDMRDFLRSPEAYSDSGNLTQAAFDAINHYIENGDDGYGAYIRGLGGESNRREAVEDLLNGSAPAPRLDGDDPPAPPAYRLTWTPGRTISDSEHPGPAVRIPGHVTITRNGVTVRPSR